MSDIEITWETNEVLNCPDCGSKMFVIFCNDEYQTHGCANCQKFIKLENYDDFQPL